MSGNSSPWVDSLTWKDRWEKIAELSGGGQGEAFKARRRSDGAIGFLKVIKSKNDPERRARFSREANAYDTFLIPSVPRLIESNAHHHADLSYVPFLVTEFIEGTTLTAWRGQQSEVVLATAVGMTCGLLHTLAACHAQSVVHRDVKPDNIILHSGDPLQPWLLDFGLNHHEMSEVDFRTEDGQEVGNRFLRLPELSAGSRVKQDTRSDVSFAAGILFYLLTGSHPDVLQDAEAKLPHQRSSARARLEIAAGERFQRLAAIFDHAFAPRLEDRIIEAAMLKSRLEIMMEEVASENSLDDDIRDLAEIFNTPTEYRLVQADAAIRNALSAVQKVYADLISKIGSSLTTTQTNFNVGVGIGENTLFLSRRGSGDYLLKTTYEVQVVGDELIVRMSGVDVYRTSLEAPVWDDNFKQNVSRWLTSRMKDALSPDALPPEAEYFKEQPPLPTLELASATALRTGRKVLAFVYDPTLDGRGQLDYVLRIFLRNRRTRDRMNQTFVTALVPLSQLRAVSEILNDASMETARRVILDQELKALEEDIIYANAEVAESQMNELAAKYSAKGSFTLQK